MADPVLVPLWVPVATAFAGGAAVALSNFLTSWRNRMSDERKHHKEIIFKTAIDNWKQNNDVAIELLKLKKSVHVMPLESYIVNLLTLSDALVNSKITKKNVVERIKEAFEISDLADQFIMEHAKKND